MSFAGTAGAEEDVVEICASASERAQVLRDEGQLVAARAELLTCAAERCPAVVRQDCTTWLPEVEQRLPSIVIRLRNEDGRDVVRDVEVEVDGEVMPASLGRAFAVDPGPRRIVVRYEEQRLEDTVVVAEGQKAQPVAFRLPATRAPVESSSGGVPVGAWVLFGVAAAGGGIFAGLGVHAQSEVDDMRSSCAPRCDPARVDEARSFALAGNVALAVGLAALAGGVTWTTVELMGDDEELTVGWGPFGIHGRF